MNNRHVYILSGTLILLGLILMLCRMALTGLPLTPGALATAWVVERQIEFEGDGNPVKLTVKMPGSTLNHAVVGEWVIANRFGTGRAREGDNRILTLATRQASGPQAVYLRALLHQFEGVGGVGDDPTPDFVRPQLEGKELVAAHNLLDIAEARSADDATLVTAVITVLEVDALSDSLTTITSGQASMAGKADAVSAILSLRGIPARRVNGIKLSGDQQGVKTVHWVEVYLGQNWQAYSLVTGAPGVPDSYLPIWRGSEPMVSLEGGSNLNTSVTIQRLPQRVLDQVLTGKNPLRDNLIEFSLYSLPLQSQNVFRVLLVVPLGIIALVLIRNVIGVKSLGTFMPVLIAMALHSTSLTWGIAVFVGIVTAGLLFRLYLEHLKLLLVPRLAAVLIFVIILMAVLSMLTNAIGLAQGLSIALFPMVIMTMTIERLSVLWDERGAGEAIRQGAASLVIAVLLCIVMSFPIFEHLFFTFPELLLVLLAIALLLGRYTGYRLLELPRFRAFSE